MMSESITSDPIPVITKAKKILGELASSPSDIYTLCLLWLLQGSDIQNTDFSSILLPRPDCPRSIRMMYANIMQVVHVCDTPKGNPSKEGAKKPRIRGVWERMKDWYASYLMARRIHQLKKSKSDDARETILAMINNTVEVANISTPTCEEHVSATETRNELFQWLQTLLQWCEDTDDDVVDKSLEALQHFTCDPSACLYLARHAQHTLLKLFEESDNKPSLLRKRCLSQLVASMSAVDAFQTDDVYWLDRCEQRVVRDYEMIGEDIVPVDRTVFTAEPILWMKFVVHMCFQQDVIQKAAGIRTLQNFLHKSKNRDELARLWSESLLSLIEPQARPVLVEEAKEYLMRGTKNMKEREWWPLRCSLHALSLFCADEQLSKVMVSNGLLQFMKSLDYHEEASIQIQICRILSCLAFQQNAIGEYTRKTIQEEWMKVLEEWRRGNDTKLHFYAEKVLYNCRAKKKDEYYLDEPMFVLYDCNKERVADIVFVHGLQGSFYSTWVIRNEGTDYHHVICWPETLLPKYLNEHNHNPPVRILSVGYQASMMKSSSPHPTLSIREQASDLRKCLAEAGVGDKPIIFVTHSMGGLIVKEMLVEDNKSQIEDVYSPLLHQTKAVLFYSTPHRGSPVVKMGNTINNLIGFTPLVTELKHDSPSLLQLNDEFLHLHPLPSLLCLGEELPMRAGKYEAVVVPPLSASLPVCEFIQMKGTNHITVCKPVDERDPVFINAAEFISKQLDQIVSLDNITAEGIVEKAKWKDRLLEITQSFKQD